MPLQITANRRQLALVGAEVTGSISPQSLGLTARNISLRNQFLRREDGRGGRNGDADAATDVEALAFVGKRILVQLLNQLSRDFVRTLRRYVTDEYDELIAAVSSDKVLLTHQLS